MKLKEAIMPEGVVWDVLRTIATGKAKIDKDSELGVALKAVEKEMSKKPPGSKKTYAEIGAEEIFQKYGVKIETRV